MCLCAVSSILGISLHLCMGLTPGTPPPPPTDKEQMRRTPAFFAGEEEAHLKKILEADDIQLSISEWASSPVLITKKDGQIR